MRSAPKEKKSPTSEESGAQSAFGAPESRPERQPDSHQAALDAARVAEEAVANSAYSPGLGQRDQVSRVPTRQRS